MRIIGLNGSPHKNGNTKLLMTLALDIIKGYAVETELIDVVDIIDSLGNCFCKACNICTGHCFKGTELEKVFLNLKEADGILVGTPVHFGTVSAQLKAFFDKSRALRAEMALYNKIAAGITVGASKFGGQETTIKALHDIFLVHGMIVVGDGFIEDDCGHHGVCSVVPSNEDAFAIKRAKILAGRMVEVCSATTALR